MPENLLPPPHGTIFDRLDAHHIPWRNYYASFPPTSRPAFAEPLPLAAALAGPAQLACEKSGPGQIPPPGSVTSG